MNISPHSQNTGVSTSITETLMLPLPTSDSIEIEALFLFSLRLLFSRFRAFSSRREKGCYFAIKEQKEKEILAIDNFSGFWDHICAQCWRNVSLFQFFSYRWPLAEILFQTSSLIRTVIKPDFWLFGYSWKIKGSLQNFQTASQVMEMYSIVTELAFCHN